MREAAQRVMAIVALIAATLAAAPSYGASTSTVVTATVPSATHLDTSGCPVGMPATHFGTVLPDSSAVTAADCSIEWGSSNDSAALLMRQLDQAGVAMYRQSTGQPDTGFGPGGAATFDTSGASLPDTFRGAVAMPDGDVIAVGNAGNGTNSDLVLARIKVDGTLEPTFGTSGISRIDLGGEEQLHDAKLDSQGRIVAGGEYNSEMLIARFDPDTGALDTTFADTGWMTFVAAGFQSCQRVVIHADQRISCGGHTAFSAATVLRVDPNGEPDTSLSGDGFWNPSSIGSASVMALDAAGRYVIAAGRSSDIVVRRFEVDGTPDGTFGTAGEVTFDTGLVDSPYGMTIDPAGRIVVAGATSPGRDALTVRFLPTGALDPTFGGGDGWFSIGFGGDNAFHVPYVDRDGSILLAGYDGHFTLHRYSDAGEPVPSFGIGNMPRYTSFSAAPGNLAAIVETTDGRIMLLGGGLGDSRVAVAGTTTVAQYAPGVTDWSTGSNAFGACLREVSGAGVTPTWSTSATCPASNGAWWNPVPTSASAPGAKVAVSTDAISTAIARLRFGFRTSASQPPGTYLAPLGIEVVAPNV